MGSACIAGPARKQHEQQRHVHWRGGGGYCVTVLALTALPLMLAAAAGTLYALDAPPSVHAAAAAVLARRSPPATSWPRTSDRHDWLDSPIQQIFRNLGKMGLPAAWPGSLLVPGPVHFGLRVPKSSSSVHDLVARSERDGEAGWGENYSPDGMTPRDVHNAATAEHCSAAAVWRWLVGSAGRGGDGRRGLRGDAIMATL